MYKEKNEKVNVTFRKYTKSEFAVFYGIFLSPLFRSILGVNLVALYVPVVTK